ncbi:nitrile hydratase accessory protein [Dongia soli]|uniref:Nitrile hydratase accessory protein n=1 Tax=Dongia soli TaxID=600628 RepID=A0ABU5EA92_9PROT|nr:nitrile hydratase accessory protein [Dongia soli]MDY0883261.1 nitrile hydratase accessory protein [Dongia soli]
MSVSKQSAPADPSILAALPTIPRQGDTPVFQEPWQAEAFAMAVALHEGGLFSWSEWAAALAKEIKAAQAAGDPDLGDSYYRHWLAALERLVVEKNIASRQQLDLTKTAWDRAARATQHGQPILIENDPDRIR